MIKGVSLYLQKRNLCLFIMQFKCINNEYNVCHVPLNEYINPKQIQSRSLIVYFCKPEKVQYFKCLVHFFSYTPFFTFQTCLALQIKLSNRKHQRIHEVNSAILYLANVTMATESLHFQVMIPEKTYNAMVVSNATEYLTSH